MISDKQVKFRESIASAAKVAVADVTIDKISPSNGLALPLQRTHSVVRAHILWQENTFRTSRSCLASRENAFCCKRTYSIAKGHIPHFPSNGLAWPPFLPYYSLLASLLALLLSPGLPSCPTTPSWPPFLPYYSLLASLLALLLPPCLPSCPSTAALDCL